MLRPHNLTIVIPRPVYDIPSPSTINSDVSSCTTPVHYVSPCSTPNASHYETHCESPVNIMTSCFTPINSSIPFSPIIIHKVHEPPKKPTKNVHLVENENSIRSFKMIRKNLMNVFDGLDNTETITRENILKSNNFEFI